MGLFDDDFYSTRVRGRSRGAGFRSVIAGSTFRVAMTTSLISSLTVAILFTAFSGGGGREPAGLPAWAANPALVETSERIIAASEKIRPAVVSIINLPQQALDIRDEDMTDEELTEYASLGSGVIFKKQSGKAFIITNAHVLQDAAEVEAVLNNGVRKEATIVGKDTISDLAVLEIDGKDIDTIAEVGDSGKLRVGEMVIAIGNPLGFGDSLTQGIVSSTRRVIPVSINQDGVYDWEQEVIQTDAAINQGNSGGALVDLNGRVVGINSMKVANMGVEGIGFAIPMDGAMPVIEELLDKGRVVRPYMGVYSMDLSLYLEDREDAAESESEESEDGDKAADEDELIVPEDVKDGVIVLEAVGPAKKAGLRFNDIIVRLDDEPIASTKELRKYLYNRKKIGESLTVTYYRNGDQAETKLELIEKNEQD